MNKELKILVLEDVSTDAELTEKELRKEGIAFTSRRVDTREDFIKGLDEFSPDMILADYNLPTFDGLSALEIKKEKSPDVPFIFVSGAMGEELAVETMRNGAADYVLKDKFFKLAPAVKRALQERQELLKRRKAEDALTASEQSLRTITEAAPDAIICIEAPDTIYLWNRKAEEMFGYSAEEAIGKQMHHLIVPEKYREKAYESLKAFYQTGTGDVVGKVVEVTALRKDGTEFPVELSISALYVKGAWHSAGIIRDITERKKAEAKLLEQLDELNRWMKATVGRELRMHEIKEENEKLKKRIEELEKKV